MDEASDFPFDMQRLRPLEIRVRTRQELPQQGICEAEANSYGRVSADALVLLRAMMDDSRLTLSVASLDGETLQEIAPSALFHLWLSFTGHVARMTVPSDDEAGARQIAFCQKVLMLLQLDSNMDPLARANAGADALTPSEASPETSTEASPTTPPDGAASSAG